jgi:hypothetical protein
MNIGSYLRFGNMLAGAYDASQQDIANRQKQQQLDNLLANSALARQVEWQNFQDQQAALGGLGAYFRSLVNSLPSDQDSAPAPAPALAPAPAPGQDSARQPFPPVGTAQTFAAPPQKIQAVPLPDAGPTPAASDVENILLDMARNDNLRPLTSASEASPAAPIPGAAPVPTFGPGRRFDHITTPEQVATAVDAKKMRPKDAAIILLDMARNGNWRTPAPAPAPAPGASPAVPSAQQGQDADPPLPTGAYGRMLALIQHNQPLNLAAQATANLLKAHPNMSDRELALAMNTINPTLTQQANAAIREAGLTDTEFFKAMGLLLREQGLGARYPGLGYVQSPYTPDQLAAGAELMRNGQPVPMGMRVWIEQSFPDIAREAVQGKAQQAAANAAAVSPIKTQQAINTVKGRLPYDVARAVDIAAGTEPYKAMLSRDRIINMADVKATSDALKQAQSALSNTESAYNALHKNFAGLMQAAKDYGLGPNTPINSVWNRLRSTVDPKYASFDLFLKSVQREFARVLNPNSGGRGITVSAMKEAENILPRDMTLGQLEAAQRTLEMESKNVLDSLRQQRESLSEQIRGSSRPQTMSPEDQQAADWAKKHPNDPRATAISRHLKEKYGL